MGGSRVVGCSIIHIAGSNCFMPPLLVRGTGGKGGGWTEAGRRRKGTGRGDGTGGEGGVEGKATLGA